MKLTLKSPLLAAIAVAVACLFPAVARAGQEKLAAKITETSQQVGGTRDQLQATMDALGVLVGQKGGDLKPAFEKFQAEVVKIKASAEVTRATAAGMQQQSTAYFDEWAKDIASVSNPKLRKNAEKRMASVKKDYSEATQALEAAGGKFSPFLSDLADIEKILANDLTAGGIKSVKDTVASAKFNLGNVRRYVNSAMKSLDAMSARLKPDAK